MSLKRKEKVLSGSESMDSDEDSPRATSPLLQPSKDKPQIRKSSSISKLQANASHPPIVRSKRSNYKRGELLLLQSGRDMVSIAGSGYSD